MQFVVSEDATIMLNGERYLLEKGDVILVEEVRGIKELKQYDMVPIGKIGMFRVWMSNELYTQPSVVKDIMHIIRMANDKIAQLGIVTTANIAFLTSQQFAGHTNEEFTGNTNCMAMYISKDHIIIVRYIPTNKSNMLRTIVHEMGHHIYKNMSSYGRRKLNKWIDKNVYEDHKDMWKEIEDALLDVPTLREMILKVEKAKRMSRNTLEFIDNIVYSASHGYLKLPKPIPPSLNAIIPRIEELKERQDDYSAYIKIFELVHDWVLENYKMLEMDKDTAAFHKYITLSLGVSSKGVNVSSLPSIYAASNYQEFFCELLAQSLVDGDEEAVKKFSKLYDLFREISIYL